MKPYISVIAHTNRVGGLDVLFEGLKHQTFKDFELVLVDSIYKYRKDIVAEKAKEYDFVVKHVEPLHNIFPVANYCILTNTGICASEGEVVYLTGDYCYLHEETLARCHAFHSKTPRNFALLFPGTHGPVKIDTVSDNFPRDNQYGHRGDVMSASLMNTPEAEYVATQNRWSDAYAEDLDKGLFDKVLWSIFHTPFTNADNIIDLIDPKEFHIEADKFANCPTDTAAPAFHDLCCLRYDSFKRDFLLDANGLDEEMDGSGGYQDTELARRLVRLYGAQFFAMNFQSTINIITKYYLLPRKITKGYNNYNIICQRNMREVPLTNNSITEWKKSKI